MAAHTDWLTGDRSSAAERRILAAAEQLFWQRGLHAVTVEAVARRAGCSRATLYRHVGGRQALVDAALAAGAGRVVRNVEAAVADVPAEERATAAVLATVEAIRDDRAIRDWLARPSSGGDDELGRSRVVGETVARLTGVDDPIGREVVFRTVLALVLWPAADGAMERQIVERCLG